MTRKRRKVAPAMSPGALFRRASTLELRDTHRRPSLRNASAVRGEASPGLITLPPEVSWHGRMEEI
ncbi:MAG: hypothetical protein OEY28_09555, partial [Nitrospira sp.]|nr:hypothetical protein [Nitrospira sp.]